MSIFNICHLYINISKHIHTHRIEIIFKNVQCFLYNLSEIVFMLIVLLHDFGGVYKRHAEQRLIIINNNDVKKKKKKFYSYLIVILIPSNNL